VQVFFSLRHTNRMMSGSGDGPAPEDMRTATELFFICLAGCWFFIAFGGAVAYRLVQRSKPVDADEIQTATVVVVADRST
jgi:hypothetical protein